MGDEKHKIKMGEFSTETVGGSVVVHKSKKKFVDMGTDAVLAVLRYLEISDLINVAQTNRFLKKCADLTIEYCHKILTDQVEITNPNNLFFRQFGHLARRLVVRCLADKKENPNNNKLHILPVIADRCQKNLRSLRLEYVSENLLTLNKKDQEKVCKLFSNIDEMEILDCCIMGWDEIMKSAQPQLRTICLQFYESDSFEEFVRKYPRLKSVEMSGMFSAQLLDLNQGIDTIAMGIDPDILSKSKLKSVCHMDNLENLTITLANRNRNRTAISVDFASIANISNLRYFNFQLICVTPIRATDCISSFMALQHHKKLNEFHFLASITRSEPIQFKEKAFENLKQLSVFADFPFISAISQLQGLTDLFFMDTTSSSCKDDLERYRNIITKMPNLKRIIFDLFELFEATEYRQDINRRNRNSLVQMCQSRTSQSELLILFQNMENNIIRALMFPNTVLMFSVQRTVSTKTYIFKDSNSSPFHRAKLLAEKKKYVAVNYADFTTGINTVGNMHRSKKIP